LVLIQIQDSGLQENQSKITKKLSFILIIQNKKATSKINRSLNG
jgi:hypothetical protein